MLKNFTNKEVQIYYTNYWKRLYHQLDYQNFDPLIITLFNAPLAKALKYHRKQGFNEDHFYLYFKNLAILKGLYWPDQIHHAIKLAIELEKEYYNNCYQKDLWKADLKLQKSYQAYQNYVKSYLKKHPKLKADRDYNSLKLFQKWWNLNKTWQIYI